MMRKVRWCALLLLVFLLGAKTSETLSMWKTAAYKVPTTVGSGRVRVSFIDRNRDNEEVERCAQSIQSARAQELSADLAAAAADAGP